jgi:hypothetical protein
MTIKTKALLSSEMSENSIKNILIKPAAIKIIDSIRKKRLLNLMPKINTIEKQNKIIME